MQGSLHLLLSKDINVFSHRKTWGQDWSPGQLSSRAQGIDAATGKTQSYSQ